MCKTTEGFKVPSTQNCLSSTWRIKHECIKCPGMNHSYFPTLQEEKALDVASVPMSCWFSVEPLVVTKPIYCVTQ